MVRSAIIPRRESHMADRWYKPPFVLYTTVQRTRVEEKRLAALKSRTEKRSQQSIDEAVDRLKRLLALPHRWDMAVQLAWELLSSGEIERHTFSLHDGRAERWWKSVNAKVVGTSRTPNRETMGLLLNHDGLHIPVAEFREIHYTNAPARKDWARWLEEVPEDDYPYVVRRFQLFPTQLGFLMEAFQAEV